MWKMRNKGQAELNATRLALAVALTLGLFLHFAYGASVITVGTDKSLYSRGSTVTITGQVSSGATGVPVGIQVKSPTKTVWIDAVTTGTGGAFSSVFKLAPDAEYGTYTVTASISGGSTSSTFVVGTAPHPPPAPSVSGVTIEISKAEVIVNQSQLIFGEVSPARSIAVTIEVSTDNESWTVLAQPLSSTSGRYSYLWTTYPHYPVNQTFYLRASIPAEGGYDAARSNVVSFKVYLMPSPVINGRCNMTLPSGANSTIEFASNSTNLSMKVSEDLRKISFNATGPSGTIGVLVVFFPRELLEAYGVKIDEFVFVVDGKEVTAQIGEIPTGYLVTLVYSHSTHIIDIYYETYELAVTVLNSSGKPVVSAIVNATGLINRSSTTSISGVAVLKNLPIGQYVVRVYETEKYAETRLTLSQSATTEIHTTTSPLETQYVNLEEEYQQLQAKYAGLEANYTRLEATYPGLQANYTQLLAEHEQLQTQYAQIQGQLGSLNYLFIGYVVVSIIVVVVLSVLLARARVRKLES